MLVMGGREVSLSMLRSVRVVLPAGGAYWTVVDTDYELVEAADAFLRDLRLGADRTESTTKLYAGELALFLGWAAGSGRDLERAARELSRFVLLLRTTPITRRGRGYGRPRGVGRINHVLAVVREFYKHAIAHRRVDASVMALLYEVGDDRYLPAELRAEDGALRYRVRPRHKLHAERPASVEVCTLRGVRGAAARGQVVARSLPAGLVVVFGVAYRRGARAAPLGSASDGVGERAWLHDAWGASSRRAT